MFTRHNKISWKHAISTITILLLFATMSAIAEIPTYTLAPDDIFMQSWLLCGPFPNPAGDSEKDFSRHLPQFATDYLASHGGEEGLSVKEGQVERYGGGEATWFLHESEDIAINLDAVLSEDPGLLAYAYCEVVCSKAQGCLLSLGSNDGAQVWLNGEVVWDVTAGRGVQPDNDIVPIALRAGRNTLLLKIEERGGNWGFACRLLGFDTQALTSGQLRVFQVKLNDKGAALLDVANPALLEKQLIDKATVSIRTVGLPETTVWSGAWTGAGDMALPADSRYYGEYVATIDATFFGGTQRSFEIPFSAGKRISHALFEEAKTDYAIVIGKNASESEQWAALELRHWLMQVSDADFPIIDDTARVQAKEIVVGFNEHAKAILGKEAVAPAADDESFQYRNAGPSLLIWGGAERGTMYGVFDFLERELGCRWYTPGASLAPQKDRYAFEYLRHAEAPGVRVRNVFYYEAFDTIWAARNRSNGKLTFSDNKKQYGGVDSYWAVHTFNRFVPPEEYFADHPEYYSLIDGKRTDKHAQLCTTNPEVIDIITKRVLQYMREHPEHRIYSVSQNDGYGPCQCDACQAVVQREGSEIGPILELVNHVADAAKDEFPDKYIGTLAYVYSRKPPKHIRPRENVVIRLCSFECCRVHDFHSCPKNASFLNDVQQWAAIAPHLYIWDYVVDFAYYTMPYPNIPVLQPNIQFLRDNKAIGIMPQAAYQSRGGDFAELKMYLISKLLWNPECDVEAVISDFMYGYYGRAGQHIRAYIDLMRAQVTPDIHFGHFHPFAPIFSDEVIQQADALFDKAETVAENSDILHRVELTRASLMFLKCKRTPEAAIEDGTYARLRVIMERENITLLSEAGAPVVKAFFEEMDALK
jgi:uncharacterized protein DUF4838